MNTQLLDVYSASAGSGKTYTLAMRVIDILIRQPREYAHILAVTFTNKATAEMKERIIRNLHKLSLGTDPQLMEAQKSLLAADGKSMSDSEISEACAKALRYILNDYSQFNISTIDKFVQRILRSFAYEMGLSASYTVDLNFDVMLKHAVDEMMHRLSDNKPDSANLRKWVGAMVDEQIKEGDSVNVDGGIMHLGMELGKRRLPDDGVGSAEVVDDIIRHVNFVIGNYRKKMQQRIDSLTDLLKELNWPSDKFPRKTQSPLYNLSIGKKKFGTDSGDDFVTFGNHIEKYRDDLNERDARLVSRSEAILDLFNSDEGREFRTAMCMRSNMYSLGLLSYLQREIDNLSHANHSMPISDGNELLRRLIDGCSVPFIYEKTGTRFNNIMIDEFQDTSRVQWDNFRPLIENSLANNYPCLIVGDVKQAIYRWRNSDWQLLHREVQQQFPSYYRHVSLYKNWRSNANVIAFNNAMFKSLSRHVGGIEIETVEDNDVATIYAECEQEHANGKMGGYIDISIIDRPYKFDSKALSEYISEQLTATIRSLHDEQGYSYSDIAVLVRKTDHGCNAITKLSAEGIPAVSNESLVVCNSPAVKAILAHLRFMLNPADRVSFAHVVSVTKGLDADALVNGWSQQMWDDERNEVLKLRGLGLVELVESVVQRMPSHLVSDQFVFVEAFLDMARDYSASKPVNLADFVAYIDEHQKDKSVAAPDGQDAVTVLTVHKSKGLQYKVVLVPYLNWEFEGSKSHNNVLWCDLPADSNLPFADIPFKYTKNLLNTFVDEDFGFERKQYLVDLLNLVYVAFTRAETILMAWAPNVVTRDKKDNSEEFNTETSITKYLKRALDEMCDANIGLQCAAGTAVVAEAELETNRYVMGELPQSDTSGKASGETITVTPYSLEPWHNRVTVHKEGELARYRSVGDTVAYGNTMHSIMSRIDTVADVDASVAKAVLAGEVSQAEAQGIAAELKQRLSEPPVAQWFDGSMPQVFTEVEIMSASATRRPDRVMIAPDGSAVAVDYKFGDKHRPRYEAQVKEYIALLRKAGFQSVRGYLWYYGSNEVKEIKEAAELPLL